MPCIDDHRPPAWRGRRRCSQDAAHRDAQVTDGFERAEAQGGTFQIASSTIDPLGLSALLAR
jgi:hypothetical protein